MTNATVKLFTSALAALGLVAFTAQYAAAQPAGLDSMREGNRLFRSGLYRAALLSYRESAAQGLDTPLLHYNLGVVHYRLGDYAQAELELQRAAEDPVLAPLAFYNRGLSSRARGGADADGWFRLALERADSRELRQLAQSALRAAPAPALAGSSAEPRLPALPEESGLGGELRLYTSARIGQDDNVYRSPSNAYVDLSQTGQPTVTPEPQSAGFVPVELLAEYILRNEAGDTDFVFGYRLDGDFYDSQFSNATTVSQRFDVGADIVLGETSGRRRTVQSAFFLTDHRQTNFDPDTGLDRDIDGVDISRRFSFGSAGVEGAFEHVLGPWTWGFDMRFERREYERAQLVANYDQSLLFTTASMAYAFNAVTTLDFGLHGYRRLYDDRRARDLTGVLLSSNPSLQYDYRGIEVGVQRKLSRALELELDYLRLERIDEFLGYENYTQDALELRASFRPNRRFRLSAAAVSRLYDYANAFAFNVPAGGLRELERLGAEVFAEYWLTDRLALWGELELTDVSGTDPRSEYGRSRSMIGASWQR